MRAACSVSDPRCRFAGLDSPAELGEDALANLSVERTEAGTITGHVRIRSKTQGIALSLGDRITMGAWILFSVSFDARR